jgi:gliding motility-associated lipoprotein GldH
MLKLFRLLPLLGLAGVLTACDQNQLYEKNVDFEGYVWSVRQKPAFTFDIADTTQRYDVYFNVRNASAYGYYNLYLKHTLTGPDGKPVSQLLHQMFLMDPQTGEPRGRGTGDIYDHQFLALPNQRFRQTGTYKLVLEQYMRQDQLPGLMAVGVRVAQAAPRKP